MNTKGTFPRLWLALNFFLLGSSLCSPARTHGAQTEEVIGVTLGGRMIEKEGRVEYLRPEQPPVTAPTNQFLATGDALHTLELSRATVRFINWSHLRIKDR